MNPIIAAMLTGVICLCTGVIVTAFIMIKYTNIIHDNSRNEKFREILEMVPTQKKFFYHLIEMMENELSSPELEKTIQCLKDTAANYSKRGMEESASHIENVIKERKDMANRFMSAIETIKRYDETCNSSLADAGSSLIHLTIANHALLDLNQGEKDNGTYQKKKRGVIQQEVAEIKEDSTQREV